MKKSRILIMLHLALWLAVGFTVQASAYIDPSVVSGLLVSVAGAVVACSAAFFIVWRKLKKKVSKTLGIDENANKEVEEDLVIKEDKEDK
ncbi:MAG: hypothetical protein E7606_02145 [Ruminococcaceae bacterium]|nr:hypothetical protein [Oscillospiraceae bacterium]